MQNSAERRSAGCESGTKNKLHTSPVKKPNSRLYLLFSILFLSLFTFTLCPAQRAFAAGGELTQGTDRYYPIEDAADLAAFSEGVNAGRYADANARLAADITLTDEWTPIGTETTPYKGVFDGAGHEISGLSIYRPEEADGKYIGLFGYIKGGTVKNLTVRTTNANTEDGEYAVTGYQYVGIIAGYIDNGTTIENCTADGSVNATCTLSTGSSGDGCYVSGIAGSSDSSTNQIIGCTNNAVVRGAGARVGGIAGYSGGILSNCVNKGEVSGDAWFVGGIAGLSSGENSEISNCTNNADVSGMLAVGGITGQNNNNCSVTNCVNNGYVTGTKETIGGIAGGNHGPVTNCVNNGNVTGPKDTGGVVGFCVTSGTMTNCVNTGTVTNSGSGAVGEVLGNGYTPPVIENCGGLSSSGLQGVGTGTSQGTPVLLTKDKLDSIVTMLSASMPNTPIASNGSTTITLSTSPSNDSFNGSGAVQNVRAISSNPDVATVPSNVITGAEITISGAGTGTAVVTVTAELKPTDLENIASGGHAAQQNCEFTFYVTVTPVLVDKITIAADGETKLTQLETETEYTFNATVLPAGATDKTVSWSVTGAEKVSENGSSVTILTGSEAGYVSITATANDESGKTGEAGYNVIVPNVESVTVETDKETMTGGVGDTANVTASVKPANAQYGAIEWASGDETTATVTPDAEDETRAVVTAKGAGEVTITATAGGVSGSCTITIAEVHATGVTIGGGTALTLEPGGTKKLTAELTPANSTDKITWTSSAPNVAAVGEDGTITAAAAGTATITATASSGVTTSVTVTVNSSESTDPGTKPETPSGGGGGGGCSAGWGALALIAAVPLMLRRKK